MLAALKSWWWDQVVGGQWVPSVARPGASAYLTTITPSGTTTAITASRTTTVITPSETEA